MADPRCLEFWHGDRKVTMYPDACDGDEPVLLKVWGPNIHDEMESIPLTDTNAVRAAFDWLYAPAQAALEQARAESEMWHDRATEAQAERDAAREEVERLRVAAERYRVLRNDTATEFGEPWAITRYAPGDERNSDGGTCPLIGEELDAACDALIALLSPTTGKEQM